MPKKCNLKYNTCRIINDMTQLWDIHVSLTREVILADVLKSPNLTSSLDALLQNQKDLGANIALYYGKKSGARYAELLTNHINIAVKIVNNILAGLNPANDIKEWYRNGKQIANFLNNLICTVKYNKIKALFDAHLDCTLEEAGLIISGKYPESEAEYKICLRRTRRLAQYIAVNISRSLDD